MSTFTAPKTLLEEVAQEISDFHEEQQGLRPPNVEVSHAGCLLIVRSFDVFTPNERQLAVSDEGRKVIQSARRELRAMTRRDIEKRISTIVGEQIVRSYYDLDVRVGEQIEVYVLATACLGD